LDKIVVAARIGKAEAAAFLKKLLREISSSFFFSLSISHQMFACSQQTLIKKQRHGAVSLFSNHPEKTGLMFCKTIMQI
jgi:hypothetical protein